MTHTKSTLANRLAITAGIAFVTGMLALATFPDFFQGVLAGLKG